MSTCIRGGVRYRRHRWVEDATTKGLVCEGCGLFPSTVRMEAVESGVPEAAEAVEPPLPANPFTLDGSSPDGA